MQLEFHQKTKKLSIKDEVPSHSWLVTILMLINAINMIIQLFFMNYKNNELIFSLMILIASVSVVVLLYYITKRSWKSSYYLNEIKGLEIKTLFGRERVYLTLQNGKKRGFSALKNEEEVKNLKETLTSIGIKST